MSNKYKYVKINLEDSLYDFIKKYIDTYIPDTDISYFLKCLVINRLMNIGVLNECGMPNDFVFGPNLEISNIDTQFSLNMSNLSEVTTGVSNV